mgnify:CR=1
MSKIKTKDLNTKIKKLGIESATFLETEKEGSSIHIDGEN